AAVFGLGEFDEAALFKVVNSDRILSVSAARGHRLRSHRHGRRGLAGWRIQRSKVSGALGRKADMSAFDPRRTSHSFFVANVSPPQVCGQKKPQNPQQTNLMQTGVWRLVCWRRRAQ